MFETLHWEAKRGIADGQGYANALKHSLLRREGAGVLPRDDEFRRCFEWRDFYHIDRKRLYLYDRLENGDSVERVNVVGMLEDGTLTVEYDYPEGEYSNVSIEDTITLTFPKGLELERMEVESGLGSIEVQDVTAQQIEISGGLGDFDATNLNASQRLYIDAGMGDVDVSGSFGGEVELNCGMGSVNLEVQGASREDFDYDLDVGMGSLSVEGVEASGFLGGEYKTSDGKDRSITVDGGMGDVKISFAE